ncbi:MAG: 30S ribosomal protein S30 [Anaerolineaceae bacterium]|nr:30S ribosomal protein S30 [Anaerolineaceae bacterium]
MTSELPIELHNSTDAREDERALYIMVEEQIRDLAKGHSDITGAAVNLTEPSQDTETNYIFEATVVLYTRPNNIAATEKGSDLQQTLQGALDAAQRQVREKRDRLRNY